MKKHINLTLILVLSGFSAMNFGNKNEFYKLENAAIHFLDGVTRALDGGSIGEMLEVRKKIEDLKLGIKDPATKTYKGLYSYFGQPCTTGMLVKIEEALLNNPESNSPKPAELNKCFKQIKHDFIKLTLPFMERMKPVKPFVLKLIKESCDKRDLKETVLNVWGNTNGNEEAMFNENMKTIREFDKFLEDVSNFIGDLLKSTPKGRKQYIEALEKQKRNKAATAA